MGRVGRAAQAVGDQHDPVTVINGAEHRRKDTNVGLSARDDKGVRAPRAQPPMELLIEPYATLMGTAEPATPAGTVTEICQTPANPAAIPLERTTARTPPIVTTGNPRVSACGVSGAAAPSAIPVVPGFGPCPVPRI